MARNRITQGESLFFTKKKRVITNEDKRAKLNKIKKRRAKKGYACNLTIEQIIIK